MNKIAKELVKIAKQIIGKIVADADMVQDLIEGLRSDFNFDEKYTRHNDVTLVYTSREYGNVGEETPGREDMQNAKKIGKKVTSKFRNVEYRIDYVDEFTYLEVVING